MGLKEVVREGIIVRISEGILLYHTIVYVLSRNCGGQRKKDVLCFQMEPHQNPCLKKDAKILISGVK